MNSFNFTAHLGSDSEMKYTQNGHAICTFSAAAKKGFGDNEKTVWLRCNLWGKRGEALQNYLVKGQKVAITGELFVSEWEKDGQKNKMVEVDVREIDLIGDKSPSQQTQSYPDPVRKDDSVPF